MGLSGISIWQMVIVLGIIILLFGTKKLRNLGGDIGSAVKGFRSAMKDEGEAGESVRPALDREDVSSRQEESAAGLQSRTESR